MVGEEGGRGEGEGEDSPPLSLARSGAGTARPSVAHRKATRPSASCALCARRRSYCAAPHLCRKVRVVGEVDLGKAGHGEAGEDGGLGTHRVEAAAAAGRAWGEEGEGERERMRRRSTTGSGSGGGGGSGARRKEWSEQVAESVYLCAAALACH